MPESVWLAIAMVLIGGVMEGSFAVPMKFTRRWAWENIWLVYSVVGLAVIPWVAALIAVPELLATYRAVPGATIFSTAAFGFGWGVANVLFGVSVPLAGMALAFAIVVGMSAALGSLIPLITLTPARLTEPSGALVLAGVVLTLAGVVLLGVAGRAREKAAGQDSGARSITLGLALCVIAGLLAPMLNFSMAFGNAIVDEAVKQGASPGGAVNAIWAIALAGGFVSNAGYCVWKLARNRTWPVFRKGSANYWLLAAMMGVLWTGGLLLYGRGASAMGSLGAAIGWPVFQATMIVVSSTAGALSGEWRGAGPRFRRVNSAGLATLVLAIVVLSIGNRM